MTRDAIGELSARAGRRARRREEHHAARPREGLPAQARARGRRDRDAIARSRSTRPTTRRTSCAGWSRWSARSTRSGRSRSTRCLTGRRRRGDPEGSRHAPQKADDDFERGDQVTPDYGEAWANRGVVHNLLEDYAAAADLPRRRRSRTRCGSTSPGLTRAHLGWSLFHQDKLVEAAKELRQAMQFQPNMCVATYRLARVYFAREEWEKAAELFQTVSDDPSCGSQEASLYLMKTRMQQGLVDDARRARDACLKISPKSCIASKCRADGGGTRARTAHRNACEEVMERRVGRRSRQPATDPQGRARSSSARRASRCGCVPVARSAG